MYAQLRLPTCAVCKKGCRVLKAVNINGQRQMVCSGCEGKAAGPGRRPVMRQ
jgi:hypothetical protein